MEEKIGGAILARTVPSHVHQLRALGTIRTASGTPPQHTRRHHQRHRLRHRDRLLVSLPHLLRPQEAAEAGGDSGGRVHIHGGAGPARAHSGPRHQTPVGHCRQRLHGRQHYDVRFAVGRHGTFTCSRPNAWMYVTRGITLIHLVNFTR